MFNLMLREIKKKKRILGNLFYVNYAIRTRSFFDKKIKKKGK